MEVGNSLLRLGEGSAFHLHMKLEDVAVLAAVALLPTPGAIGRTVGVELTSSVAIDQVIFVRGLLVKFHPEISGIGR